MAEGIGTFLLYASETVL